MLLEKAYSLFLQQILLEADKIDGADAKGQKINIFSHSELGRILTVAGTPIFCQKDDFIIGEMLSHLPLCTHKEPSRVLLLGLHPAIIQEVLRHPDLDLDVAEENEELRGLVRKHFTEYEEIWDHPRLTILKEGAANFVREGLDKSYDVIIAIHNAIFDKTTLAHAYRILKDDGLLAANLGTLWTDFSNAKERLCLAGEFFKIVMPYRFESYLGHGSIRHALLCSKFYHPTADLVLQRADLIDGLSYYTAEIHTSSFQLPAYLNKELRGILKK